MTSINISTLDHRYINEPLNEHININKYRISNLGPPSDKIDACNKEFVETKFRNLWKAVNQLLSQIFKKTPEVNLDLEMKNIVNVGKVSDIDVNDPSLASLQELPVLKRLRSDTKLVLKELNRSNLEINTKIIVLNETFAFSLRNKHMIPLNILNSSTNIIILKTMVKVDNDYKDINSASFIQELK